MWRKVVFRGSKILKFFDPPNLEFFLFLGGHAPEGRKIACTLYTLLDHMV
jgi:hypothetical protein